MQSKTAATFLCVLLLFSAGWARDFDLSHKTLNYRRTVNEDVNRNYITDAKEQHRTPHGSNRGLQWVCVNATSGINAIVNGSVAVVLDIHNNRAAGFNGRTLAGVIFDFTKQAGTFLPVGSVKAWNSTEQNITQFISGLRILHLEGEVFPVQDPTAEIQDIVTSIFAELEELPVSGNDKKSILSLEQFMSLLLYLNNLEQTSLYGILDLVEGNVVNILGDLRWLVKRLAGADLIFFKIGLNLSTSVELGVPIDLTELLQLETGGEVLIYILNSLSSFTNLASLEDILNDPSTLMKLMGQMGRLLPIKTDITMNLLYYILEYLHGNGEDINPLGIFILLASVQKGSDLDLTFVVNNLLSLVHDQNITWANANNFTGLVTMCEKIKNHEYQVDDVDISGIIDLFVVDNGKNAVELSVSVIIALESKLDMFLGVSLLFSDYLSLLNSSMGVNLLSQAFPDLKIPSEIAESDNIVGNLFAGLDSLVADIVAGNINSVVLILKALNGVSTIYNNFDDVVQKYTNGTGSLRTCLYDSSSSNILADIKEFIILGLNLDPDTNLE